MYSSERPVASFSACWMTQTNSFEGRMSGTVLPLSCGSFSIASRSCADPLGVLPEALENRHHHALLLLEQGGEQVRRGDLGGWNARRRAAERPPRPPET